MSYGDFLGVLTVILLILFIGICVWAWSRRNVERFDRMSEIPLEDEKSDHEENRHE
ncbi:MAG: cbb3-type cytochrome oxidase subunit 3 [Pseudomonadota bacterium]